MSEQQTLFFDDIEDAMREVIRMAGGPKNVGTRLWPEVDPDKAARRLMDCLNDTRREALSPAQVLLVMKIGRQVGCHSAMNYIARECGYADPQPIEPEDEVSRLQRDYVEATKALLKMAERIETMQGAAGSMRRVA